MALKLLGQPVDVRPAGGVGRGIDRLDQRPPGAGAARLRRDVEVLQVADVLDLPAVAVEDVVREPDRPPVARARAARGSRAPPGRSAARRRWHRPPPAARSRRSRDSRARAGARPPRPRAGAARTSVIAAPSRRRAPAQRRYLRTFERVLARIGRSAALAIRAASPPVAAATAARSVGRGEGGRLLHHHARPPRGRSSCPATSACCGAG